MAQRRKAKKTGGKVLDADTVAQIAAALVPAVLPHADRQRMHDRILDRVGAESTLRESDNRSEISPASPSKT